MDRKTIILFIGAFLIIGMLFIEGINFSSLATDSGFDTSYDSGGSSGSSGGFSSGSSSSSSGRTGSGNSGYISIPFVVALVIILLIQMIYYLRGSSTLEKKIYLISFTIISLVYILLFGILALLVSVHQNAILLLIVIILFSKTIIISIIKKVRKYFGSEVVLEKVEENPKVMQELVTELDQIEFYSKVYRIYLDIQKAWMNFDYEMLRKLLTDELYNTYYNQLQTLSLKNQKNVMNDFKLQKIKISNVTLENGIENIRVILTVSFFDYIEENGTLVRGNKNRKVKMTYLLTLVRDHKSIDACPHCGAKLENDSSICTYCNTHIQVIRNDMRLAKKEVLEQESD